MATSKDELIDPDVDAKARAIRDGFYDFETTDENWIHCGQHCREDLARIEKELRVAGYMIVRVVPEAKTLTSNTK